MTPKQKLESMKPSDLILLMVDGLQNPVTDKVDMDTYGRITIEKYFFGLYNRKFCVGCAATNTLIKLCDMSKRDFIKIGFDQKNSIDWERMSGKYDLDVNRFESAIDTLRKGIIPRYNRIISEVGFRNLVIPDNLISNDLAWLDSENYKVHLSQYKQYALFLKVNGF